MATSAQTPAVKTPKARKPVDLVARVKTQLSTAALKGKVSVEELDALTAHIGKLKALLA